MSHWLPSLLMACLISVAVTAHGGEVADPPLPSQDEQAAAGAGPAEGEQQKAEAPTKEESKAGVGGEKEPRKASVQDGKAAVNEACKAQRLYIFSWPFVEECDMRPRGGTTQGTAVTLDPNPHPGWLSLKQPGLSQHERDRRAILAMAGPYRTTFDFLETLGFTPDFKPDAPYQSWATEYVYVLEEKKNFISLQHIIVMFFKTGDDVMGPVVTKHWRQDWQYEKQEILAYIGNNTWQKKKLDPKAVAGTWAQAVYQVDDSPRYESYGHWQHEPNFSRWQSELTWRPLPRREFSVRSDYQLLEGYNSHVILPNGWAHEEENYKLRIGEDGKPLADNPYLAKELGLNRYERIVEHDFSGGDEYWQATSDYWALVRAKWQQVIDQNEVVRIKDSVDNTRLFYALFQFADELQQGKRELAAAQGYIDEIFEAYVQP